MPRRTPLRYKMDSHGEMRPTFNGKFPEEFNERDMLAFAADIQLAGKVSKENLTAIHTAGCEYQGGAVIPRLGKEETYITGKETKAPMKLDVTVRAIEPKGNLMGFASVKFNDCFVVEDSYIVLIKKL